MYISCIISIHKLWLENDQKSLINPRGGGGSNRKIYTPGSRQSSPLLSVLGQQFDKDSNKNLIKDSEKDVEVQTETQALAGLMEFLELSKVTFF